MLGGSRGLNRLGSRLWGQLNRQQRASSSLLVGGGRDCHQSVSLSCRTPSSLSSFTYSPVFGVKTPWSCIRFCGNQVDPQLGNQVKWEETGVYSTPAMVQYSEIKVWILIEKIYCDIFSLLLPFPLSFSSQFLFQAKYPEHLVLFQMGEFYEMFGEDAEWSRRTLGLAASTRKSTGILMTGVPIHLLGMVLNKSGN